MAENAITNVEHDLVRVALCQVISEHSIEVRTGRCQHIPVTLNLNFGTGYSQNDVTQVFIPPHVGQYVECLAGMVHESLWDTR